MNDYTYPLTDFPNNAVDLPSLTAQVQATVAITAVLTGITVHTDTDCVFSFATPLGPAEITALDAVVAAHLGIPTPIVEILAMVCLAANAVTITAVDPVWQRIGGAAATLQPIVRDIASTAMGVGVAGNVTGTVLQLRLRQVSDDTILSDGTWTIADTGGNWEPHRLFNNALPNLNTDEFVVEASMSDNLGSADLRSLTLGIANITIP